MKNKINIAARVLLGLLLFVFGLNKFLQFMPPPPMPDAAITAFGGLIAAGFIMPTIGVLEVVLGALLLVNKVRPLTLLLLLPISYSIVAFHVMFDLGGIGLAAMVALLNLYLIFTDKNKFLPLLK